MITARKLSRRFGDKRVLEGVDLDVPRGGFVLVTGPNGSGKTTLLRLCAGLPLVYRELTALENLDLYGRLYRIPERRERCGAMLERFGLWDARNERAGTFSRGMLQRLALCRTFLHEPDLLLLDEPFDGLDAEGAELLQQELVARSRCTALVATHDPDALAARATGRLALA